MKKRGMSTCENRVLFLSGHAIFKGGTGRRGGREGGSRLGRRERDCMRIRRIGMR